MNIPHGKDEDSFKDSPQLTQKGKIDEKIYSTLRKIQFNVSTLIHATFMNRVSLLILFLYTLAHIDTSKTAMFFGFLSTLPLSLGTRSSYLYTASQLKIYGTLNEGFFEKLFPTFGEPMLIDKICGYCKLQGAYMAIRKHQKVTGRNDLLERFYEHKKKIGNIIPNF